MISDIKCFVNITYSSFETSSDTLRQVTVDSLSFLREKSKDFLGSIHHYLRKVGVDVVPLSWRNGNKAFGCIDMQKDFMDGGGVLVDDRVLFTKAGSLAVAGALQLIPRINAFVEGFLKNNPEAVLFSSQDYHPANHGSFASVQGVALYSIGELKGRPQVFWPDHCVQDTEGCKFVKGLDKKLMNTIFQKGMDPTVDSYSAFFDNGGENPSGLHNWLQEHEVTELHLGGVATDYCVYYTALDAHRLGYKVIFRAELTAGVAEESMRSALDDLRSKGVQVI